MKLALLLFNPRAEELGNQQSYPMMICIWRLKDGLHEKIEDVIGKSIGHDWPYAAPGWEPEADAKNWIDDVPHSELPEVRNGWTHGTPEKLSSLLVDHKLLRVERLGKWSKNDLVNNDERILELAQAKSPLSGVGRQNRHRFRASVTPRVGHSWNAVTASFLKFISFEPLWREQAEVYLEQFKEADVSVELIAFDVKHLVHAIFQAPFQNDALFSFFEIIVRKDGDIVQGMCGQYTWDGETCPPSADTLIHEIYGGVIHALIAIGSAVDENRYEQANVMHGFVPVLDWIDENKLVQRSLPAFRYSIRDFVTANPAYCAAISETFEQVAHFSRPRPSDGT